MVIAFIHVILDCHLKVDLVAFVIRILVTVDLLLLPFGLSNRDGLVMSVGLEVTAELDRKS